MTFKLGLTGSIGMGKSTTAQMFADLGCAVWDADGAVHRLYSSGIAANAGLAELVPDACANGVMSRDVLRTAIMAQPDLLKQIEQIVHPLVAQDRADFLAQTDADIAVFDIPLLFETGGDRAMDAVVCVWIDPDEQERRVMARGTMTAEQFHAIRAKQLPIDDKLAQSQYRIHTDTPDHARQQVASIVSQIRTEIENA